MDDLIGDKWAAAMIRVEDDLERQVRTLKFAGFDRGTIARALDRILSSIVGDMQRFNDHDLGNERGRRQAAEQIVTMRHNHELVDLKLDFFIEKLTLVVDSLPDDEGLPDEVRTRSETWLLHRQKCEHRLDAARRELEERGESLIDVFLGYFDIFHYSVVDCAWPENDSPLAFAREMLPRWQQKRREFAERMDQINRAYRAAADYFH